MMQQLLAQRQASVAAQEAAEAENVQMFRNQAAVSQASELRQTMGPGGIKSYAAQGIAGGGEQLPHMEQIQQSFGGHDVSGIKAHVGGPAAQASHAMGAKAFASGENVAFDAQPDVRLAAHEAAHVIQQRDGVSLDGGVGRQGDPYERNADSVANRVVMGRSAADLLPSSGSPACAQSAEIQRYGLTPKGSEPRWRVSDSNKSAIEQDGNGGGNRLYATDDIIADGDKKLLAASSAIGLVQSTDSLSYEGNTLYSVAPYLRDKAVKETDPERTKKLKKINSGDEDDAGMSSDGILALWTDCGKAARTIMGVQDTGTNPKATTKIGDSARSGSPSRYSNEMYPKAIKAFFGDKASEAFLKENVHYTMVGKTKTLIEPTDANHAKRMYYALGEDGRDAFDKHVGINVYVDPEIGDAYNMVTEKKMPGYASSGRTWNFHWAGVIAKDGVDNLTLEGYAVSAAPAIKEAKKTLSGSALAAKIKELKKWAANYVNRDWVFQMYGKVKGESFHDDHLESGTHGNRATTFHVNK